ncbi:MAG: translation initiation factor IF-3, partial [Gammaproteobacteria bacterium]|nr:translation initiation factor IF-3 [Gammaproteobacteria bacterium]
MVANKRVRRNEEIDSRQLRVIGADGQMIGVLSREQALEMAASQELDLVEVSPNAEPPVCKIMDFGKFRYEESIKRKVARKNQKTTLIK